jgi:mono/diheme cytochrome c family protein
MKTKILLSLSILTLSSVALYAGDAKELYAKECAKCHGAAGKGETKMGQKLKVKDFTEAKRQAELTDEAAFKAIRVGIRDGDKTVMKGNAELSDQQINDLVTYVRKFKR